MDQGAEWCQFNGRPCAPIGGEAQRGVNFARTLNKTGLLGSAYGNLQFKRVITRGGHEGVAGIIVVLHGGKKA